MRVPRHERPPCLVRVVFGSVFVACVQARNAGKRQECDDGDACKLEAVLRDEASASVVVVQEPEYVTEPCSGVNTRADGGVQLTDDLGRLIENVLPCPFAELGSPIVSRV